MSYEQGPRLRGCEQGDMPSVADMMGINTLLAGRRRRHEA